MVLQYIIWNISPKIFHYFGNLDLRWYSILFALGFFISQQIGSYIFRKDGLLRQDFDRLTLYMVVSTIVGARLGHILFYDLDYYLQNPIEIFLPISFNPSFRFIGYQGLASHGAAFGILFALFLFVYYRIYYQFPIKIKIKKNQGTIRQFFWVVDRVVIVIFLAGSFIRLGNFMNSEIIGKPTKNNYGVVFFHDVKERFLGLSSAIRDVSITKCKNSTQNTYPPVKLTLTFDDASIAKELIENYITTTIKECLTQDYFITPHIYQHADETLSFTLKKNKYHSYTATIITQAIPRHPAQLYEIASLFPCFLIFFFWWKRKRNKLKEGTFIGLFLIIVFGLRFFYEFFKENQVEFENSLIINMGQLLSIPLVLAGIIFLFYVKKNNNT